MQVDLYRISAVAVAEPKKKGSSIEDKPKPELEGLVRQKDLRVKGTGKNEGVLKKDLIRVLQQGSDEEGQTIGERERVKKKTQEESEVQKKARQELRERKRRKKERGRRIKPVWYGGKKADIESLPQGVRDALDQERGKIGQSKKNAEIVEQVAKMSGQPKSKTKKLLGAYWRDTMNTIWNEGQVDIPGIGVLKKHYSKPRQGINPATGERIKIPGRWQIKFKPLTTRAEIKLDRVEQILKRSGIDLSTTGAEEVIKNMHNVLGASMFLGMTLPMGKFGKFYAQKYRARWVRSPKTGKLKQILPQKRMKFKGSKVRIPRAFKVAEAERQERELAEKMDGIVEKARQEDPGISGPPKIEPKPAMLFPDDPEASDLLREVFGDKAEEIAKEIGSPPENIPTSGEVPTFKPGGIKPPSEGEKRKLQEIAGDLEKDPSPENIKRKLSDPALREVKQGFLQRAWSSLSSTAAWGISKLMAKMGVSSAVQGILGSAKTKRVGDLGAGAGFFAAGIAMAIPASLAWKGAAAAAGVGIAAGVPLAPVAVGVVAAGIILGAIGGYRIWTAIAPKAERRSIQAQRGLDEALSKGFKTGDLNRESMAALDRGESVGIPYLDNAFKGWRDAEDALEKAAKVSDNAKEKKRLQDQLGDMRDRNLKRELQKRYQDQQRRSAVQIDLSRIGRLSGDVDEQTEQSFDLDAVREGFGILDTVEDFDRFENRFKDLVALHLSAVAQGQASLEDFKLVNLMREAAA